MTERDPLRREFRETLLSDYEDDKGAAILFALLLLVAVITLVVAVMA